MGTAADERLVDDVPRASWPDQAVWSIIRVHLSGRASAVATIRIREALTSSAPVSRRAFATTVGAGGLALAAVAAIETLGSTHPFSLVGSKTAVAPTAGQPGSPTWNLLVTRGGVSLDVTSEALDRFAAVVRSVSTPGHGSVRFGGILLSDLMSAVGGAPGARIRAVSVSSGARFSSRVLNIAESSASSTLIATTVDGRALTPSTGAPARLVTSTSPHDPGRLVSIEVLG